MLWRISLLVSVVTLVSCAADAPAPPPVAKTTPTLEQIRNAEFPSLEGFSEPIQLKDGSWEGKPFSEGSAVRPTATLLPNTTAEADLDGDGTAERLAVLSVHPGGTGEISYLAVMEGRGDVAAPLAVASIGDRVQLRALRAEGKRVLLDVLQAGADDAMCCPGELATRAYELSEGALREVDSGVAPARFTPDSLDGSSWLLATWAFQEPANPEPRITLAFKEGRAAGMAGCNNYSGQVKAGEQPGDVTIGPIIATRKACPPPQMEAESRYLKQLGAASKIGYQDGRLAVSYTLDGSFGFMTFDRAE